MQARLPLNNLNTFAAAADTLSFQSAAERLHVTPSAVSHQIRNLEDILGYPLFERLDKRVNLTARGEQLYANIHIPLMQIHDASIKALRRDDDNNLTLSVAPVFATRWLLPKLKSFNQAHPEINLSIIATNELANFRQGDVDASIRMGKGKWLDTQSIRLLPKQIIAVCNPHLLKTKPHGFTQEELRQQSLIHNTTMPTLWHEWFISLGLEQPDKLEDLQVQNSAQLLEAVQSSDGIGLVDINFVRDDIQNGRIGLANERIYESGDGYYFVKPKRKVYSGAVDAFEAWVTKLSLTHTDQHQGYEKPTPTQP